MKDPHKRAIYDTLGEKALNDEQLYQIVKHSQTPEEIRLNYEKIMKGKEEEQLKGLLQPRAQVTIGLNANNLFKRKKRNQIKFNSMGLSASIDLPISKQNKLSLTGLVSSQDKKGHHAFTCSLFHPFSDDLQTELHLTAADRYALKLKGTKYITKQDVVSSSLIFSPELMSFYSKELNYLRILSKYVSFNMQIKSDLTNLSAITNTLSYNKDKNKFEFEFTIGMKNSYLSLSYIRSLELNDTKLRTTLKYGFIGSSVEYGCETKLTKNSIVGATIRIGDVNGISVKLHAMVSNQAYALDISLNDEITLAPIVYGTICPMLTYLCIKKYLVEPYQKALKDQKDFELNRDHLRRMNERKKEAELSISLMQDTYLRSCELERNKESGGLLIEIAIYGNSDYLVEFVNKNIKNILTKDLNLNNEELKSKQLTLVTVPLQCLIKDSVLFLPEGTKVTGMREDFQIFFVY